MARILCLNGPNLNLLGTREPETYGRERLDDIAERLRTRTEQAGHELRFLQSNAEHALIDAVHQAGADGFAIALINPAGYTHTSVALRDALLAVNLPFIEIHLSNIHAREDFRAKSYFSDIALGVISGLGALGYELALDAALHHVHSGGA